MVAWGVGGSGLSTASRYVSGGSQHLASMADQSRGHGVVSPSFLCSRHPSQSSPSIRRQ